MRPVRTGRIFGGLVSLGLLLPAIALATVSSPAEAVITGNVMSGTASPMWQTNGIVRSVLVAGNTIYAGGDFTAVRPPGTNVGSGQSVTRNRVAAFNATTGAVITTFNANANGRVSSMSMSPDGTRLYIAGSFTTVGGVTRNRVAAVNPTTGALITSFNANVGSTVNAVAASSSAVYIGGAFTRVGGVTKSYLASVNPTTGALNTGFNTVMGRRPDLICTPGGFGCNDTGVVTYNPTVTVIAVTPDSSTLLVGGNFIGTNGNNTGGMASLDPATGATRSWGANSVQPINTNCVGRVSDISIANGVGYVTGEGDPPGCYEGTYSARLSDGALNWNSSCLGASQAIAVLNGVLYKGSHEHDCAFNRGGSYSGYVGGTSRGTFIHRHLIGQDITDGSSVHWSPDTNGAGNQPVGPRALDAATLPSGTSVIVVGGDFTLVNDVRQQGLTRFVSGGDTATPAVPGRNINADKWVDTPIQVGMRLPITAQPTAAGTLTVQIPAVDDADTGVLTYRIYRDGGNTAIATLSVESFPWSRPVLRYNDTGLAAGSTHTYRVSASDGVRTSALSTAVSGTVSAGAPPAFITAYGNVNPDVWWRLDGGSPADDNTGNGHTGDFVGGVTPGQPGAVNGDAAVTLDGSTGYLTSSAQISEPNAFAEAAWFKTTSTTGGVIVAQSDRQTGPGGNTDRLITMDNNGGLVFAMKAGLSGPFGVGTINIRNQGPVFNDGQWHLVVGSYDGDGNAALYVDGWLQGTATGTPFDPTAKANGLANSYLRAGYADMTAVQLRFGINFYNNKWPLSHFFDGSLDEVTAFNHPLTQAQVSSMFAAGVGAGA
ncbi:putative LamG domain protein jellyroll fold domain protein [metagenome]|uniref:Putative LamG domain protein jellyroll fold domain protein n=1 Tax=metagenome TaxID=256318 RepID=A0A2P2C9C2_9ZZZZ